MRGVVILGLLAAAGLAGAVRSQTFRFEISPAADWETLPLKPKTAVQAHFHTYFEEAPRSTADVQLMVIPDRTQRSLEELTRAFRASMEKGLTNLHDRTARGEKLGGEPCRVVDVRGDRGRDHHHLTWLVTRRGEHLYLFFVRRTNQAIGDADVEAEIRAIRASFRFLRAPPPAADPSAPKPPPRDGRDAAALKCKPFQLRHWRLACVKPAGLREVVPDDLDKANDVVLRFEGRKEQSSCLVRIYAQARHHARHLSLKELVEQKKKRFELDYPRRLEPEVEPWKPPLGRHGVRLRLTGLRGTPETLTWYLAECRNDRQYQIEILVRGAAQGAWSPQVADLLAGFRPLTRPQ
ncbi:MAG: hypothetical protein ACYTED_19715 [Planctomycetota bacterium]|jgi:hypothetical protein